MDREAQWSPHSTWMCCGGARSERGMTICRSPSARLFISGRNELSACGGSGDVVRDLTLTSQREANRCLNVSPAVIISPNSSSACSVMQTGRSTRVRTVRRTQVSAKRPRSGVKAVRNRETPRAVHFVEMYDSTRAASALRSLYETVDRGQSSSAASSSSVVSRGVS